MLNLFRPDENITIVLGDFDTRGMKNVNTEWRIMSIAHNIRRWPTSHPSYYLKIKKRQKVIKKYQEASNQ